MVILAAVDGRHAPDRVVSVAADLADAYGTDLVVMHVFTEQSVESTGERMDGDYFVDEATSDAADIARDVASSTLEDRGIEARGRVGDPAGEILDLAGDLDPAYVVVGGRKRTPVGKAVFGSVTQSVLLEAERPVVTVKQE